jgi:hypothetical protein
MEPVETQATVAVLAAYLEGRKDGFAAGVTICAAALLVWKGYKRDRSAAAYRVFGNRKG